MKNTQPDKTYTLSLFTMFFDRIIIVDEYSTRETNHCFYFLAKSTISRWLQTAYYTWLWCHLLFWHACNGLPGFFRDCSAVLFVFPGFFRDSSGILPTDPIVFRDCSARFVCFSGILPGFFRDSEFLSCKDSHTHGVFLQRFSHARRISDGLVCFSGILLGFFRDSSNRPNSLPGLFC